MTDRDPQVPWTEDQWNRIRQVVREESRQARVAASFLPILGPLGRDVLYVAQPVLEDLGSESSDDAEAGITVDDTRTLRLATLQTRVLLRSAQVADPALASASIAFARASKVLARLEDEIIFNGQEDVRPRPQA